jgi:hypothetical protein
MSNEGPGAKLASSEEAIRLRRGYSGQDGGLVGKPKADGMGAEGEPNPGFAPKVRTDGVRLEELVMKETRHDDGSIAGSIGAKQWNCY